MYNRDIYINICTIVKPKGRYHIDEGVKFQLANGREIIKVIIKSVYKITHIL